MSVGDLPPITVVIGAGGHKFCLDNRRLFILKDLRRKGILPKNTVTVLMRKAPPRDLAKYTTEKYSLNCTIMREKEHEGLEEEEQEGEQGQGQGTSSSAGVANISPTDTDPTTTIPTLFTTPDSVREKNDKKKNKVLGDVESDEERYLRQKRMIAEKQEVFRRQAAERQQQKVLEQEALLKRVPGDQKQREGQGGEGADRGGDSDGDSDSDSDSDSDEEGEASEEESDEEVFVCDVCR
jgi:hypothetical protein